MLARFSRTLIAALLGGAALAQIAAPPQASDFGKRQFEAHCASCHGATGQGTGPLQAFLRRSPPDLTLRTQKNQGVLPTTRLHEVIEGGDVVAHGTRDMPVWGREYRIRDAAHHIEMFYDPAAWVRSHILPWLKYIHRLQRRCRTRWG